MAKNLANWSVESNHTTNFDWWGNIYEACAWAVLERDDEALRYLERVQKSSRLVWDPVLRDLSCLKRFADDPVYRETLRIFDKRRTELREQLPATLAEFGVKL